MNNKTSPKAPSKKSKTQLNVDLVKEAKYLTNAERFLKQENYIQALDCYRQLLREGADPAITEQIHFCQVQLLRRYAKQGKADLFTATKASYGWKDHLALPLARMQGEASLRKLTEEASSIDATLAACTLEKDLKSALMQLRKLPLYKEMAEGWICLLKGNFPLAKQGFDLAKQKIPYSARMGHAIRALLIGQKEEADALLEPLRPLLSRCLPKLAEAMHWGQVISSTALFRPLFYSSSEEIETALKKYKGLFSSQEKGWLSLRAGDLLWMKQQNNHKEIQWSLILSYWSDAMRANPLLRADVAKRRMILSEKCEFLDTPSEWKSLCMLLEQIDKKNLDDYLTYSAQLPDSHFISIPLEAFYTKSSHIRKKQKWILLDPPPSFYFLFCRQIAYRLRSFDRAVCIPPQLTSQDLPALVSMIEVNEEECFFKWSSEDLESCLSLLDQTHRKEPLYLKTRYALARLTNNAEQMRGAVYQDLLQDPSQKDLLIPYYLKAFFKELRDFEELTVTDTLLEEKRLKSPSSKPLGCILRQSSKLSERVEQLKQLHQKFPHDYDIARLMILCLYDDSEAHNQWIAHTGHLSRQLAHLLHCQIRVDIGESQETVLSFLPEWKECKGSPEAQERWIQLLFSSTLASKEKWDMPLKDLSAEELHILLKRLEARGEIIPFSFMMRLREIHKEPCTAYHEALCMLRKQEVAPAEDAVEALSRYEEHCDRTDHPDHASVAATYHLFSAYLAIQEEGNKDHFLKCIKI